MYSRTYKMVVSLPPLLWVGLFLLLPYALMFAHSFWLVRGGLLVHQWNLQNYHTLLVHPLYAQVLLRTMRIAGSVTLLALLLGYPLAYYLSFHAGVRKEFLYQLVIVPLWVSYLVRGYAWKTILGSDGVLNGFLQYLHITHEPVGALLYSPFAVIVMLTHIYTPFVFLPIYASLEHIPRPLVEASHDLGANRLATFLRVILPLSMPGLLAGATFAFVLSLGDFLAPLLVGGPSGTMIANIVQSLFGAAYDWPLGAAVSVCILLITVTLLLLTERLEKRWSFKCPTPAQPAAHHSWLFTRALCLLSSICRSSCSSFTPSTATVLAASHRAISLWVGTANCLTTVPFGMPCCIVLSLLRQAWYSRSRSGCSLRWRSTAPPFPAKLCFGAWCSFRSSCPESSPVFPS